MKKQHWWSPITFNWKTVEWKTAKKKTDNDIAILIFLKDNHVNDSWVKESQVKGWQWNSNIDENQRESFERQMSERQPSKKLTMKQWHLWKSKDNLVKDSWVKTAKKKTDNDIAILIFEKDSHVKDS